MYKCFWIYNVISVFPQFAKQLNFPFFCWVYTYTGTVFRPLIFLTHLAPLILNGNSSLAQFLRTCCLGFSWDCPVWKITEIPVVLDWILVVYFALIPDEQITHAYSISPLFHLDVVQSSSPSERPSNWAVCGKMICGQLRPFTYFISWSLFPSLLAFKGFLPLCSFCLGRSEEPPFGSSYKIFVCQ